jgi:hypothetical protein
MPCHCASIDFYASYIAKMKQVYGADCPLMTRERWDAACRAPRNDRVLTNDEFDDSQFSEENGDGPIY